MSCENIINMEMYLCLRRFAIVWCQQCYVWYFEIFKMAPVSRSWWSLKPKVILVGDDVVTMYGKLDCIVFSYCDAAGNWEIHSDFRFWPICWYRGTWPFTFDLENIWVVKVHLWVIRGLMPKTTNSQTVEPPFLPKCTFFQVSNWGKFSWWLVAH